MLRACWKSVRGVALVLLLAAAAFAQSEATVLVTGHVPKTLTLKAADLARMPRASSSTANAGVVTTFEGVWLSEILSAAGLPPGGAMVGYVVASASDGYQMLFSLAEMDPTVTENQYLLADKANGNALSGRDGTFRLVVPKDIRAVRSIRQLARLEVVLLNPPAK